MQKYYAMKAKDDELRMASSSGGVFYVLGCQVLAQGGVVYGACYDENWQVVHRRAKTVEQLRQFSGSKYARSNWNVCLPQIKEDLCSGIPVLFSGTPCQAAAVRKLETLGTLYVVDVVCHGTPKPVFLEEYLKMMEARFGAPVQALNMRYKSPKRFAYQKKHLKSRRYRLDPHTMRIVFANGKEYCADSDYDPYFLLTDRLFYDNCYHCSFRGFNRQSDLTLGDFHEFSASLGAFNDRNGVSLVLVNSEKGKLLLNSILDSFEWQERIKEDAVQPALVKIEKPKDADVIKKRIMDNGFSEVANEMVFQNARLKLRRLCDQLGILDLYLYLKTKFKEREQRS